MRVLILGNSQSLSWKDGSHETVPFPTFLGSILCGDEVHNASESGDMIDKAIERYLQCKASSSRPGAVILQYGIVECSPRVFLRREKYAIQRRLPRWISRVVMILVHELRPILIRGIGLRVEMEPLAFSQGIKGALELMGRDGCRLVLMTIPMVPDALEQVSPGIQSQIRKYNDILKSCATEHACLVCDIQDIGIEGDFLPRSVHFIDAMSKRIAEQLAVLLRMPQ